MYPNLSYLLHDILYTPVDNWTSIFQMSGLSLVFTFIICALLLKQEITYRENIGLINPIVQSNIIKHVENISMFILCSISGYKIFYVFFNVSTFIHDPRGVILSINGSFIGFIISALFSFIVLKKSDKTNSIILFSEIIWSLSAIIVTFTLFGIKLFGILEVDFSGKSFQEIFNSSGTNFYGGLTGGVFAGYLICRFYKVDLGDLLNSFAPIVMIGYSIGRLGCHVSGDGCWGKINNIPKPSWFIIPNWLWSYNYPQNVINEGKAIPNLFCKHSMMLETNVFPTSLYESIFGFIMFFILKSFREKLLRPYQLFICFLFLMGIQRFFIEFIRVNNKYTFVGLYLSQAQFFSLFLILIATLFLINYKIKQ
jgi:phosphatidylglycerol---prolipoprotein diacylglyceryl transferase